MHFATAVVADAPIYKAWELDKKPALIVGVNLLAPLGALRSITGPGRAGFQRVACQGGPDGYMHPNTPSETRKSSL